MKIGICTWSLECYDFKDYKELIDFCSEKKLSLDVSLDIFDRYFDWANASEKECKKFFVELKAYAKKKSVEFYQTHIPYGIDWWYNLKAIPEDQRYTKKQYLDNNFIEVQKKAIYITYLFGTKYAVIHPIVFPYEEENVKQEKEFNVAYLRELADYAMQYGVNLCLENIYDWKGREIRPVYVSFSDGLKDYVESIDRSNVFYCVDTGHANDVGEDVATMIRKFDNKTKTLHLHDNFGIKDDHLPLGIGKIDWKSVKKALNEVDYRGVYNLEIKPFAFATASQYYIKFVIDVVRKLLG